MSADPEALRLFTDATTRCEGYIDLKMWSAASDELKGIPGQFREDLRFLTLELEILVGQGEHEKASAYGQMIIERFPNLLGVVLLTAECLLKSDQVPRAREIIKNQLTSSPEQPDLWLTLARI